MSQRSFFGLIALLVVTFGVFWASKSSFDEPELQEPVRFLSGVNSDSVQRVVLIRGDESIELQRKDDTWVIPARDGFPADPGKVRSLMLGLFELKSSQKITDQEQHYDRLGVSEAAVEQGKAKVQLFGTSEAPLAELYIGEMRKQRAPGALPGMSGQYVRRGGSSDVFLVGDRVVVNVNVNNWLLRNLANILPKGIERAIQYERQEDGSFAESFVLVRTEQKEGEKKSVFALGSEAGQRLETVAATQVQTGLENMRVLDVQRANEAAEGLAFDRKTQYMLSNGLVYSITTAEQGDKYFAKIDVSFNDKVLEGEQESAAANLSSAEEAGRLDKQYDGWVFELPKYLGQKFRVSRDSLMQDNQVVQAEHPQ